MKTEDNFCGKEYYKITLVGLNPDRCVILKGPKEEKMLVEVLRDDYQISRYEKMLQLVIKEKVEQSCQEACFQALSLGNLKEAVRKGEDKVVCSYLRDVQGKIQRVSATVYPRKTGKQRELEEFIIYVTADNKT